MKIKFKKDEQPEFFRTLQQRVNQYFIMNNIEKTGNTKAQIKAGVLLVLYLLGIVSIYFSNSILQLYKRVDLSWTPPPFFQ